ncbi:DUF3078 domain-containing protein [Dysgonomonas sp. 216]|uniref:DUF3078 domain-containing protein n=1 Tax=Dysgonomonas sp. 216 TaxID=2302934 RepID=UPI0013D44A38|nr:DUF3078 domain-containing protein [Dysgonomonas sp. 216]NDW18865.1 DUF3078 domain-containing protein [Dysgonomonas sp. 216]
MRKSILYILLSFSPFFIIDSFSSVMIADSLSVNDSLKISLPEIVSVSDSDQVKDSLVLSGGNAANWAKRQHEHVLRRDSLGLIAMSRSWSVLDPGITFMDTMFYNPAYLPVIFEGRVLPDNIDLRKDKEQEKDKEFHLISPEKTLKPFIEKTSRVKAQRRNFYMQPENMTKVKFSKSDISEVASKSKKESEGVTKNIFDDILAVETPSDIIAPKLEKVVPKRVYWRKNGEHSLQISQNYISDNWHKGGNSSYSVRSNHKFNLNYEKGKVKFNNSWEWRLGLQSVSGDTLRDVNINDDFLRMYNMFGYRAFDKWSYSATLDSRTQVFNSYKVNSTKRETSFLAPLYVNLGVGMSYNLEKKFKNKPTKKLKLSLDISALSLDFRYVGDDKVNETKFGLEKDHHSKTDYGSKVNVKLDFAFNSYVSWYSEAFYFTNYERAESEWQNTFNMVLNRFWSTKITAHLRFDDNVSRDDKLGYLQVNELISFGLNYKW